MLIRAEGKNESAGAENKESRGMIRPYWKRADDLWGNRSRFLRLEEKSHY